MVYHFLLFVNVRQLNSIKWISPQDYISYITYKIHEVKTNNIKRIFQKMLGILY